MTKEEFLEQINISRCPKYTISQIKEGAPDHDCVSIVCTSSDNIVIAKYENGKWQQACFTSTDEYTKQEIYYVDIKGDVAYWTDGEPEDCSREEPEGLKVQK